jgi:hypothetical protein
MAVTESGLYVATFVDVLDTTQLAIDLDLETHKLALYANTITPNFATDAAYSATGEHAASGSYVAGGFVLTGTSFTGTGGTTSGVMTWDAADWSQAIAVTDVRAGIIYADALAGNNLIACIDFGALFTSTGVGPFVIQWNASGIFSWTVA